MRLILSVIFLLMSLFSTACSFNKEFAGLVKISQSRQMYLQCKGMGSPTVVFISGFRGAHDDWTHVLSASNTLRESETSVFAQASLFTRVCAYDRPGTTLQNGTLTRSTPVSQPTTAQQGAEDLHALLLAAGEGSTLILVAHSWGALNAYLFASRFAEEVSGLVLVDPGSAFLRSELSAEQWTRFVDKAKQIGVSSELEAADYESSVEAIRLVAPLRSIPSVVLTADKPFDFGAGPGTWQAWLSAQELLANELSAEHVTQTNSAHFIQGAQPQLVVNAIRVVVEASRNMPGTRRYLR